MFWIGLIFFSGYALIYGYDELHFHRARGLSRGEKHSRVLNTFLIAGAIGYALFIEFSTVSLLGFNLLLGASLLAFPLPEFDRHAHISGQERYLHSVLSMLHPIMLILLFTNWKFIDGAGFFLGMVLPFSTGRLRPLCYGYFAVMTGLLCYQVVYWNFIRAERAPVAPSESVPVKPEEFPEESIEKTA